MKKLNTFAAVASLSAILTAAVSCSDDEAIVEQIAQNSATPALKTMTFSAGVENNSLQKTHYGDDMRVLWDDEEYFMIFPVGDDESYPYKLTSGAGTTKCEMEGEELEAEGYYALYPYSSDVTFSDGKFTDVYIDDIQAVRADQFENWSDPLVAYTSNDDMSFNFRRVGAKLGVTVPIDGVNKITITCSEPIAGTFDVAFSDDPDAVPVVDAITDADYSINFYCVDNDFNDALFQKGQTYYACVLPTSKDADLTITCHTSEGPSILYSGKIGPMLRNTRNMAAPPAEKGSKHYTLAALDKATHFPSSAKKIVFGYKKDYDVDALNLDENGDPLGDIEFYMDEAEKAYYILSDKEICLTGDLGDSWEGMFDGCDGLKELVLDNFNTTNVTSMRYMFYSCNSLTTLDLSSFNTAKVKDMSWMFLKCNNLQTINVSNDFVINSNCETRNMFGECPAEYLTYPSAIE